MPTAVKLCPVCNYVLCDLRTTFLSVLQGNAEDEQLEIELTSGFERLLTHGLANFHKLHSKSTPQGLTCLRQVQGAAVAGSPSICCSDIVFALAENPPGGLTAAALDAQLRRNHLGSDAASDASFVIV